MKFEFDIGVPSDCIEWLWQNVGTGNIKHSPIESNIRRERQEDDDWYYRRMQYEVPNINPKLASETRYVPTIFIEDEKKAILFALRWL
jgi:hypothetical protein